MKLKGPVCRIQEDKQKWNIIFGVTVGGSYGQRCLSKEPDKAEK